MFCRHAYLRTTCMQSPKKPEKGIGYAGSGVVDGREPFPRGGWEANVCEAMVHTLRWSPSSKHRSREALVWEAGRGEVGMRQNISIWVFSSCLAFLLTQPCFLNCMIRFYLAVPNFAKVFLWTMEGQQSSILYRRCVCCAQSTQCSVTQVGHGPELLGAQGLATLKRVTLSCIMCNECLQTAAWRECGITDEEQSVYLSEKCWDVQILISHRVLLLNMSNFWEIQPDRVLKSY